MALEWIDLDPSLATDPRHQVPVSVQGGTVTVDQPVAVTDGGGSLTVDGAVAITGPVVATDGGGSLTVDPQGGAMPVSGTVSATQGTTPWVTSGTSTVSGTVAVSGVAGTVTVGDGGGSLTVDGTVAATQGTSPWVVSGAVTVPNPLPVSQSTSPWVTSDTATGATNSAKPARAMQVGGYVSPAFTDLRAIEIDAGNGTVSCDSAHHEQHEGMAFKAFVKNTSLGNGASQDVLIDTGASNGRPHMTIAVEASSSCEWFLYESPTVTGNGSAVSVYNAFRDSAHASTTLVYSGPSTTATGAQIDGGTVGGVIGASRVGAPGATRSEWILKTNTKYLFRVTNDTNTNRVYMKMDWYSNHDANGGHVL